MVNEIDIKIDGITFFDHGRIGVEFFFLVSGYLMAMSAHKVNKSNSISKNTWQFTSKKLVSIFPYHLFAFIATEIAYFLATPMSFDKGVDTFVSFIPNFFLIQRTGIYSQDLIGPEWYISAMLVSMFIIYPLILKYSKSFTRIICPIITITLIGYLSHKTGMLGDPKAWVLDDSLSKTLVRAFAELCFGVFIFEIVKYIERFEFSKAKRIMLTITEAFCYLISIYYAFADADGKYDSYIFYVLAVGVTITFSEKSYFNNIFRNKFVYYLGRLTLPLYLCQKFAIYIVNYSFSESRFRIQIIMVAVITIALAFLTMYAGRLLQSKLLKSKNYIKLQSS